MASYASQVAAEELSAVELKNFHYLTADMRNFDLPAATFDTAWILLGSLQHMTTNDDVVACFSAISNVLTESGTLVLELPHPNEAVFGMGECTRNSWKMPLEVLDGKEEGELHALWGDEGDAFDPVTQIRRFTVELKLTGGKCQTVREVVPMRVFTAQEINALARLAGFHVVAMHGALEEGVDVHDEEEAYRLVCVLQKTV
jgi:SAM-dependent methyltransferase